MDNFKDYITINTSDGKKEQAELVSRFEIENKGEYVIYKLNEEYYAASYSFDGTNTILDTNLSEEEKELLNKYFVELGVE